jgi:hypothetical protein
VRRVRTCSGAWRGFDCWARLTFELLEHALDGAGAAAAGHGNVELVCVGHREGWGCGCRNAALCWWKMLRFERVAGLYVAKEGVGACVCRCAVAP